MKILQAVVALSFAATSTEAQVAPSLVASVDRIEMHSSFWVNLHMTLYAEAISGLGRDPGVPRLVARPRVVSHAGLSNEERTAWEAAIDYYKPFLARQDLRIGEGMTEIQQALMISGSEPVELPALTPDHRRQLVAAAPVYRRHWWPAHDRAIRAWIADVSSKLGMHIPEVRRRQTTVLETEWFAAPVRAEIAFYGRTYTTLRPTLTTIAIADSAYAGWAGAEMLVHEVSHALTGPLEERIRREAASQNKNAPDLWHVCMFYLTGEVWRSVLAARGVEYAPYLYATGLFDRAWSALRRPIETHLKPLIDGRVNADTAYRRLLRDLPQ